MAKYDTGLSNLVVAEPDIARVPIMIDSSKWEMSKQDYKWCKENV
ncbi:MAG: hypothetical protein R2793_01320 [Flavobacteriaceae bacterium]